MTNPRYQVNISYAPGVINGQTAVNINGVTQSQASYSTAWYVASMPELGIGATGTSYSDALNNVMAIATASTFGTPGYPARY
jgi:hypothetical protein